MSQLFATCVLLLAIVNTSVQSNCGDVPADVEYADDCTPSEIIDAQIKNETFYAAIRDTLTNSSYKHHEKYFNNSQLVDCIVGKLNETEAIASLDDSTFEFSEAEEDGKLEVTFLDIDDTMNSLERMIEDASSACQPGTANIALMVSIVFLVILAVVCVAVCIGVRLVKRVKWSAVQQQQC
jgi:hypothetical protein